MTCETYAAVWSPYVDGELTTEERSFVEAHVADCHTCRSRVDSMRALKHAIARLPSKETPPVAVRARIESLRFNAPERSRPWWNTRTQWTRRHVVLLAGALVAAAAGIALVMTPRPGTVGEERAHSTAEFLVDDHLKYARQSDRSQLATGSLSELQGWFEQQVQLAAKLPELRGTQLLGGRRCSVQGRPAALAFYEKASTDGHDPEPLSLFVFEPDGEDWSYMAEAPGLRGKRVCGHHERGVGLLIWEERGLVYAVAGALDAEELRELVAGGVE